jgi:hypothetical protein
MTVSLDQLVAGYITLRDRIEVVKEQHKQQLAPMSENLKKLEAGILQRLQAQGMQHAATAHGTAYIARHDAAAVRDWDQTLEFVKANSAWGLLERRVSKNALRDFLDQGIAVPGVELTSALTVNVRRNSAK